MLDLEKNWPQSLSHLCDPFDDGVSEHIVVAKESQRPHRGYKGIISMTTALVPLNILEDVLAAPGGVGWEVSSWGPGPCVGDDQAFDTFFWIDGRKGHDEQFQTLVNSWVHHDKKVLMPDNIFLMAYGLVPRSIDRYLTSWDDPSTPRYDVVRVNPLIDWNDDKNEPYGVMEIRREYLEDYCQLKKCAAVAVYYEERYSIDDPIINEALGDQEGIHIDLHGRQLGLAYLNHRFHEEAPQIARIWGSALILIPRGKPVTEARDPVLEWPDHEGPMTLARASNDWLYVYVHDSVLQEYENRAEFVVYPESGAVSFGGWWSVGYCSRIGKNHIKVELKKLYEGCPPHVITHWHRYAVSKKQAQKDSYTNGDINIANLTKEIVNSYLFMTQSILSIADSLNSGFKQQDIGSIDDDEVAYAGWWRIEQFRPLANTVKPILTQSEFLSRAAKLFQLFELLKPAVLRNLLLSIGLDGKRISDYKSLKLFSALCQICALAEHTGLRIAADAEELAKQWDPKMKVGCLDSIFALNGLRDMESHAPSRDREVELEKKLAVFGIEIASTRGSWSDALHEVYGRIARDLGNCAEVIRRAM